MAVKHYVLLNCTCRWSKKKRKEEGFGRKQTWQNQPQARRHGGGGGGGGATIFFLFCFVACLLVSSAVGMSMMILPLPHYDNFCEKNVEVGKKCVGVPPPPLSALAQHWWAIPPPPPSKHPGAAPDQSHHGKLVVTPILHFQLYLIFLVHVVITLLHFQFKNVLPQAMKHNSCFLYKLDHVIPGKCIPNWIPLYIKVA